jgi:hypothetical protein
MNDIKSLLRNNGDAALQQILMIRFITGVSLSLFTDVKTYIFMEMQGLAPLRRQTSLTVQLKMDTLQKL